MSPRRDAVDAVAPRGGVRARGVACAAALIALVALGACGEPVDQPGDARPSDAAAPPRDGARDVTAPTDATVPPGDTGPARDVTSPPPDGVPSTDAGPTVDAGDPFDRSRCAAMPDVPGTTRRTVTTRSGATISYVAFVPSTYAMRAPAPVVLAMHGAGDVATNYLAAVWQSVAQMRGVLVVAPDGSCAAGAGNTWCGNDANGALDALSDFEQCYSVDRRRRIVNGFSAGGILAYAIGMQAANAFAGVAISAADLGSAEALSGRRLLPAPWTIPVSHYHGTMDMNFPIAIARMGRDRLMAAGHTVYWHEFAGGHTTNAMFALSMFDDLAASRAPLGM